MGPRVLISGKAVTDAERTKLRLIVMAMLRRGGPTAEIFIVTDKSNRADVLRAIQQLRSFGFDVKEPRQDLGLDKVVVGGRLNTSNPVIQEAALVAAPESILGNDLVQLSGKFQSLERLFPLLTHLTLQSLHALKAALIAA